MSISVTDPTQTTHRLHWIAFDQTPIMFANQFMVQYEPDEFIVTMGQATGPPVAGTPEQMRNRVVESTEVPILTLARLGLTRVRANELIGMLQEAIKEHDRL